MTGRQGTSCTGRLWWSRHSNVHFHVSPELRSGAWSPHRWGALAAGLATTPSSSALQAIQANNFSKWGRSVPSSTGPRPARRNVSHLGSISPSPGTRPGRLGKSLVRKHSWSWESQSQFYPLLTTWRQTCHQWECTLRLNESDFSPRVKWTQCYYGCCENRMRWFHMKRSDSHNSDSVLWTAPVPNLL